MLDIDEYGVAERRPSTAKWEMAGRSVEVGRYGALERYGTKDMAGMQRYGGNSKDMARSKARYSAHERYGGNSKDTARTKPATTINNNNHLPTMNMNYCPWQPFRCDEPRRRDDDEVLNLSR